MILFIIQDLFINKEIVMKIVEILNQCLNEPEEYEQTVDSCASLACYISTIIYTENFKLMYGAELLLGLFSLSCNPNIDTDSLSKDTLWEVSTAWQDALCVLSLELDKEELKNLLAKFANIVEEHLLIAKVKDVDLVHFSERIANVLRCWEKSLPLFTCEVAPIFFDRPFLKPIADILEKMCKYSEFISGNLSSPYELFEYSECHIGCEEIVQYFLWKHLILHVIMEPVDVEDDESDAQIFQSLNNNAELVAKMFYDITMARLFLEHFNTVSTWKINI